jgi:signal transduction histidine kinase
MARRSPPKAYRLTLQAELYIVDGTAAESRQDLIPCRCLASDQRRRSLSSTLSRLGAAKSDTWLHRWIFYLAAGFMFAATVLRSLIVYGNAPVLNSFLLAWLVMFAAGSLLYPRFPKFTACLIMVQAALVLMLLLLLQADYFAILFAILGMQAMQQFPPRLGGTFIGVSAGLTFLALLKPMGAFEALALAAAFSAVSVFAGAFILASRRARAAQAENQTLVAQLQEANRQLQAFSRQQEQLAAARERQVLARELHDSVTQTIFSMTLAAQSALLLLDRDRQQVTAQLDRLDELAQGALAEMQVLISKLAPEKLTEGGFIAALQQHLADRRKRDNLSVTLEVEGSQPLAPAEESGLFRIAQEALNNIVKHAGASQAVLRLHLANPVWLEIEDQGAGFDPQPARERGRVGLSSMQERAAEIGWALQVDSAPGRGTRIRAARDPGGAR